MTHAAGRRLAGGAAFVVVGVLVAALSLRGPIVAPSPVLSRIADDLALDAGAAGAITTVPVLMFAAFTPLAPLVIRRAGPEWSLLAALCGVLVGTLIRLLPGYPSLILGMAVIGISITVGNVVIPVLIRRDVPPARVATVTAAYGAVLNVGSLLTSLGTAPIAEAIGWSAALAVWGVLTLAGIVVWTTWMRRSAGAGGDARFSGSARSAPGGHRDDAAVMTGPMPVIDTRRGGVFARPVAWLLAATFGMQTLIYYGLTAWLPAFAAETLSLGPAGAGALASIFQGVGIIGAFIVPLLARFAPPIVPALTIGVCFIVLGAGLLLAPESMAIWLAIGAVAHSGGFVAVFSVLVQVARSDREAASMSALVQSVGYVLGAMGAPLVGGLYEYSGGWSLPMLLIAVLGVAYTLLLTAATIGARRSR